jgi:hypothetical protein
MIRLKSPAISLDNVSPRIFLAIALAAPIWERHGAPDVWITGANEEGHSTGPRGFHRLPDGTCQAVDLRTWNIPRLEDRHTAAKELADVLGPLYDVLYEKPGESGEHVHVQYDPERPGTSA